MGIFSFGKKPAKVLFLPYFQNRIRQMQEGEIFVKKTGRRYSRRTKSSYWTALKYIAEYEQKHGKLDAWEMDDTWFDTWYAYLVQKGLRRNSICSAVNRVRTILRQQCLEENIPFPAPSANYKEELTTQVYNTTEEILRMKELDLKRYPGRRRTRNGYIIQCYIGLRYGDLRRVLANARNYLHEVDGKKYFRLKMEKTTGEVVIPLSSLVVEILKANEWQIKLPTIQMYNRNIKWVARRAGITHLVTITYTRYATTQSETIEKCNLMSSHTARRTFSTNAFLAGVPSMKIRKITGHKSETTFLSYIRADAMESAISLADHPFFQ